MSLACAAQSFLVLEFRVDGFQFLGAVCTHELRSTTLILVVLQHFSGELEVTFVAALNARIRGGVARTEPTLRAEQAHSFTLVFLCILEHAFVEVLSLQYVVAGVAAPRCSVTLALDAFL